MAGLRFHETLRGGFHFLDAPTDERAIDVDLDIHIDGLRRFAKERTAAIEGKLVIEGFVDARVEGRIGLAVVRERRLPYELTFEGPSQSNGGGTVRYRLVGEKYVGLLDAGENVTHLPMSLYDPSAREIARATLRFDVRSDLKRTLRSLRPFWSR
ncbi:hypothetical protein BH09MYX1_BH09MYX1_22880 [soil metagenome]